jgi:hypothetical protein
MPDYEIRLIKCNGQTDLVYIAHYPSDDAAKARAESLKSKLHESVEVWCEDRRIIEESVAV